jgi:hypothetical protein
LPAASACTSLVVSALPPMPQSPLSTSSTVTHGIGQLLDDLSLLILAENVFDDANLNERHLILLSLLA